MQVKRIAQCVVALAVVAVLVATLQPAGTRLASGWYRCVICGHRGLGDLIVNLILFIPLGIGIAMATGASLLVLLAAGVLSASVEAAQFFVPGRYPSVGDVISNSLGAMLGVAIVRGWPDWAYPSPNRSSWLALAAALLFLSVAALTGRLLQPSLPHSTYFAQWTARHAQLQPYSGQVQRATLGGRAVRPGRLDSEGFRAALLAGEMLELDVVAGRRPPALAPLLSVNDGESREILLVGVDRDDLVIRSRLYARDVRLDQPDLRLVGALAGLKPGAPLAIQVREDGRGRCLTVNQATTCGQGHTLGRAWALLFYADSFPVRLKKWLDAGWLAGLLLPLGFWLRRSGASGAALVLALVGLLLVPRIAGLLATPPAELTGAGLGFGLGVGIRRLLNLQPVQRLCAPHSRAAQDRAAMAPVRLPG